MIKKNNLWLHFFGSLPLKNKPWWKFSFFVHLAASSQPWKHGERVREKKFKKTASLWSKHMGQVIQYCHNSFIDNSFHSRALLDLPDFLTIICRMALQHLEMLLRYIKMSLFRMAHITPAKFVDLRQLPIRIKRTSFLLK